MTLRTLSRSTAAVLALLMIGSAALAASGDYYVYIGTYTRNKGKGIYSFHFNASSMAVTPAALAAEAPNPSFLAVHPNGRFLYASNEHPAPNDPEKNGTVTAFTIDPATGNLTLLNRVSARGEGPAHIVLDKTGRAMIVANYLGGSVALLPVTPDGKLGEATAFYQQTGSGPVKGRQDVPHAHGAAFSPDNRFAILAEHGIDEVMVYRVDAAKSTMVPAETPIYKATPGAAPRHVTFSPSGRFVYVLNEIGSTITVYGYGAAAGTLSKTQEITTLPADFHGNSGTAQLQLDRAGKFLYASNRGHDSIAVFAVDPKLGTLRLVEHVPTQGKTPRDFSLDPTGGFLFVANQNSDNVVIFKVNPNTGKLTPTGIVISDVPEPVCVVFVAAKN